MSNDSHRIAKLMGGLNLALNVLDDTAYLAFMQNSDDPDTGASRIARRIPEAKEAVGEANKFLLSLITDPAAGLQAIIARMLAIRDPENALELLDLMQKQCALTALSLMPPDLEEEKTYRADIRYERISRYEVIAHTPEEADIKARSLWAGTHDGDIVFDELLDSEVEEI